MPDFLYYVSDDPAQPSPLIGELSKIAADSVPDVAAKVRQLNGHARNGHASWLHVLVWASDDGELRGFESQRLR